MKSSMITTLIAAPLLSLSSMVSAMEPASAEPVLLSAIEMDGVTAGTESVNYARTFQYNRSRTTVVQVSAGNIALGGNGGDGGNGGTGEGGAGLGGISGSLLGGTSSANGTGGAGTGGAGGAGGAGGGASAGNQFAGVVSGNFSSIRQR
jgi:hypothetical protein